MPRKGMRSIFFKPSSPSPSQHYSLPPPSPLHPFSDSLVEENIQTAESLITKWDSVTQPYSNSVRLFSGTRQEAKQYLNAVKGLQSVMKHLVSQNSSSRELVRAQSLMQLGMKTLEKEFYQILKANKDYLDPETVSNHSETVSNRSSLDHRSSFSDYDDYASEDEYRIARDTVAETERVSMLAVADLKAIADCMISTGYGRECVKVYVIVRKSIVDEAMYNLGVEKLSFSQVQKMDWEVLELKIRHWLNAVKVAVGTLFHGERILCDSVFSSAVAMTKRIPESCFVEIARDCALILFGFPEMVAKSKKSPEKMFRTLDLYESIADNWQQIETIFSFESLANVRSQAVTSMVKIGDAVRTMLTDFESAIQKESSKTAVPGGGIHPLTRYVTNYISLLADYSGVLSDILADYPPQSPLPESYYKSPSHEESPLPPAISERFAWLILVMLCKLDGKAEFYNDVALSYLFLANNMQYVVEKVRKSNLAFLLGAEWLENHESKVKEYVSKYERVGWSRVLSSLPENSAAEITAEQARACFGSFTAAFHETCRKQSSWVVPDPKLRDEIKVSLSSKLVPKYREFFERNRVGSGLIMRFLPDDIGNLLSDILYGDSGGGSSHSSSSSSSHRSNRR